MNGKTTSTTYDPAWGYPATVTNAKNQTTSTVVDPTRGNATLITDPNGAQTRLCYDRLGRLAIVYLPLADGSSATAQACPANQDLAGANYSYYFGYAVWDWNANGAGFRTTKQDYNRVQSLKRQTSGVTLASWKIIDGRGTARETQTWAPDGTTRVVSATVPNAFGEVETVTDPYNAPAPPAFPATWTATYPPAFAEVDRATSYDPLGRVTAESVRLDGVVQWTTTHTWDGRAHTVTPPSGPPAASLVTNWPTFSTTTRLSDVHGRLSQTTETGLGTTTYSYDTNGDLTKITDPLGNATDITYDMLGRRLTLSDRNMKSSAGTEVSSYAYDASSNLIRVTDPVGNIVATRYDELNRPCYRARTTANDACPAATETTTSATQRIAEWRYDDTTSNPYARGRLTRATSFSESGYSLSSRYTQSFLYDARGRVTSKTSGVPLAEGFGTNSTCPANVSSQSCWTTGYTYNLADQMTTTAYPDPDGTGSFGSETVTTGWNAVGLPATLTSGAGTYVASTSYDNQGRLDSRVLGGASQVTRDYNWDAFGRLTHLTATKGATTYQNDSFAWDANGMLAVIRDNTIDQQECFQYDARQRLTRAFTKQVSTGACNAGTANPDSHAPVGAPAYDQAWQYNSIGNITTRTDHKTGIASTYCYNTSGATSVRPHALSRVISSGTCASGGDIYGYNQNGSMTTRTVAGTTSTLGWEWTNRLAQVTVGTASTIQAEAAAVTVTGSIPLGSRTNAIPTGGTNNARNWANPATGQKLAFTFTAPAAGRYQLTFRHSTTTNATATRQLKITPAGGAPVTTTMSFGGTTGANTFTTAVVNVNLNAGNNTVELEHVTGNTGGIWLDQTVRSTGLTRNVYDADGQRILRVEHGRKTVYIDGHEITTTQQQATPATPWTTSGARRYYTVGGTTVAVRTAATTMTTVAWLLGNHQGTATLTLTPDGTNYTTARQRYLPYGNPRGNPNQLDTTTERGFLGQTEDNTTTLTYLNARHYDPNLGVFISVDPIALPGAPQTLNPYTYSGNNPTTFMDPSGLCFELGDMASLGIAVDADICEKIQVADSIRDESGSVQANYFGTSVADSELRASLDYMFSSSPALRGSDMGILMDKATDAARERWKNPGYYRTPGTYGDPLIPFSFLPYVGELIDTYDCVTGSWISCLAIFAPFAGGRAIKALGKSADDIVSATEAGGARFVVNSAGDALDTARVTIPGGKYNYLLENPSKSGVFADSMGFNRASLDSALRSHLVDNFGMATPSVPMVGGGTKFSVTGPMVGPSGAKWTITTVWGVDVDGTIRLITATP
jgi:RHS repeat-associated protein